MKSAALSARSNSKFWSIRTPSLFIGDLCDESSLEKALDDVLGPSYANISPSCTHRPLPDSLYLILFRACVKLKALPQVQRIRAHIDRSFPSASAFILENLILTLAKCGGVDEALLLFDFLPQKSVFAWSAIISGLAEYGRSHEALYMHQRMLNDGFEPDAYTFVPLFKACGNILDLETGIKLHDVAKTQGFTSHMIVLTALLSMYANCNALEEAETIFNCFSQPDVVCWNAMLSAYVNHGEGVKALRLYLQMHEEGMCPTIQTVIIAIQACGVIVEEVDRQTALEISCTLHAYARKRGFISHEFVHTTLVSVYGKCGRIEYAENVFTEQPVHHLSLWNGMISAYVDQGSIDKALQLFWQMVSERVSPDQRTYVLALQACISCMKMDPKMHTYSKHFQMLIQEVGEALHADAVSAGFLCDVFVVTSLVTFYGRCRLPEKAEEVFCRLGQSTAVVWNALLCAYIEGGLAERALGMLKRMKEDSVLLDATSILCILQGCNDAGTLDLCLELHFAIVSLEQDSDLFLRSALIHTYGGCADIKDAEWVFHGFPYQDVATWNAHSTGCVMDGNMMASACLFEELHLAGLRPDGVTYAAVISACNHAGKVDEALEYFMMMDWFHNILPDSKHLVSITDLLGRAGDFTRLESVLQIMSKEHIDPSTWLFLLGACRTHGNLNLAKEAFEYAVGLKPKQATAYISMSNIYAEAGITDQFLESG